MPSLKAPRIAINRPAPSNPAPIATALAARASPIFLVQQSDGTVANMLSRWAKDSGWTVHWDGAPEILITGNGKVEKPDFMSAADFVISDARAKGYAIKAKAFADNVLEIKKVDQ